MHVTDVKFRGVKMPSLKDPPGQFVNARARFQDCASVALDKLPRSDAKQLNRLSTVGLGV